MLIVDSMRRSNRNDLTVTVQNTNPLTTAIRSEKEALNTNEE